MKIVSKIAEKILSHCSECGGYPIAKIRDAQAETKDNTSSKKSMRQEF